MELFLYDLFVWFNFIGFCIALIDKCMEGDITTFLWVSIFAFGGCGSALGCYMVRHHTRSGLAVTALVVGIIQLIGVKFLIGQIC